MAEANPRTTAIRMIQNFGATRVIFRFLVPKEVTKLQGVNRFLYEIGVGRSQTAIVLYPPVFFYNPANLEKLFVLNSRSQKVFEQPVKCTNDAEFWTYYNW